MTGPPSDPTPPREDPGWPSPTPATILAVTIPGMLQRHATDDTVPAIIPIRRLYVSFAVAPMLFLLVLVFALPVTVDHLDDVLAWTLVAIGTLTSIGGPSAVRRRRVVCGEPAVIARQVSAAMFFGVATSQSAALFGFAAAFVTGAVWPYVVALVPAYVGLIRTAPTRAAVTAFDRRLASVGCPLLASTVLYALPGDPASPSSRNTS